jgi:flagellar biosynthesis/type III secretory pathway protein FliH
MRNFNLKKIAAISALGLVAILGTSSVANAQGGWRNDRKQERKVDKQHDKIQKQRAKIQAQRDRLERQRQAQWNNGNDNRNRYRVYRNGGYYNTDYRGAELLRQAVNRGYQEGFRAGQADRNNRRGGSWNNSSIYRDGNYGYQTYVDRSQYQHYFQQGFQRGYQDGYNSRYQYGSNNNGSLNILGTILNQVLNLQQY